MRVGELRRRRCGEPLDQLHHDLPVLMPPETGRAEGAGRRLDPPLRPGQTIDGQVPQQRTANGPGRRRFQLPLAQGQTQAAGQMRQELRRLHAAPETRVLRGQRRQPIQNGPTASRVTQRSWNHRNHLSAGNADPLPALPSRGREAARPNASPPTDAASREPHSVMIRSRALEHPMPGGWVIWLNGAFGVGKTTVARALAAELPGALLVDPEDIGRTLRRIIPAAVRTSDFQDIPSWRRITVAMIGPCRRSWQLFGRCASI